MTLKAIIFQLDGALLRLHHTILAETFQRWDSAVTASQFREASRIARISLADEKRDPALSNHTLWLQTMQRELQISQPVLEEIICDCADHVLLKFEETSPLVAGVAAVQSWIQDPSMKCAIFVDGLQPASAICPLLSRAGLPVDGWDFIAHSASVHFDSRSPALFAEIIARLGVEPDEALFVGEKGAHEIDGAIAAGLHAFDIAPESITSSNTSQPGKSWSDLAALLDKKDEFTVHAPTLNRLQVISELRGNLGALFGLLVDVSAEQWHQHPWGEEWSITQILCHLWDREQTEHLPRLRWITEEDEPFIVAPPPPPGPEEAPCQRDGFQVALHFQLARQKTLGFLGGLAEADWQKSARHSIFGPTTLLELAHFTAQHDRLHLNQLCQTLGECES